MKADDLVGRIGGRTAELLGDPPLDRAGGNWTVMRSPSAALHRRWASRSRKAVSLSVKVAVGGRRWTRTSGLLHVKRVGVQPSASRLAGRRIGVC
jgi:uncharacterized phage protein gp47/JayE